jgi:hypothetical protein
MKSESLIDGQVYTHLPPVKGVQTAVDECSNFARFNEFLCRIP